MKFSMTETKGELEVHSPLDARLAKVEEDEEEDEEEVYTYRLCVLQIAPVASSHRSRLRKKLPRELGQHDARQRIEQVHRAVARSIVPGTSHCECRAQPTKYDNGVRCGKV
jgi:hypothetical protein